MAAFCADLKTSDLMNDLINRGLSQDTIDHFQIGSSETFDLVFPVRDASGKGLGFKQLDGTILRPDGKVLRRGRVFKRQLYLWSALDSEKVTVVEDVETVWQLYEKSINAICGTAGPESWADEWSESLKEKVVRIAYSSSEAGQRAQEKLARSLKGRAKRILVVKWPDGLAEGFGVIDWLWSGRKVKALPLEKVTFGQTTLKEAKRTFRKWLHLDPEAALAIDAICATIVANRFKGEPLWLFIVAASGGAKTEILLSIFGWREVYPLSALSRTSLISGFSSKGGEDPSLLPRLDRKVLVIKDFTTTLSMHGEEQQRIFGDLRDAYDGQMSRAFGTGVGTRSYRSKFGIIAAVTPAIDKYARQNQILGERFIRFRLEHDEPIRSILQATKNSGQEETMRRELAEKMEELLLNCKVSEEKEIEVGQDLQIKIVELAGLIGILRSGVARNGYSRNVLYRPRPEIGTRLAKQFIKFGRGLAAIRGKDRVGEDEYWLVLKIARDTLPSNRHDLVEKLYRLRNSNQRSLHAHYIAEVMETTRDTARIALEDLFFLNVVKRTVYERQNYWDLEEKIYEAINDLGLFAEIEAPVNLE